MRLPPYILFENFIDILSLEMASPGNQHCANCTGTLSFRTTTGERRTERATRDVIVK